MISWKHSLRRLNEEFEVAKKKKHALDNLLSTGRISQPTYDTFSRDIDEAITEIERQQQVLREKMSAKTEELEGQVRTLEMLLANFEIQHVTGEVDEEVYQRQVDLLSVGLDNSRRELDSVKDAINQLSAGNFTVEQEISLESREPVQISKTEVEVVDIPASNVKEKPPEPPIEPIEASDSQPTETDIEGEEKQET